MSNTVSEDAVNGLAYVEQTYWETGYIPTPEKLADVVGVTLTTVKGWFKNKSWREALLKRGVDLGAFEEAKEVLTFQQLNAANMYFNTYDKRSMREKLDEIGVSTQQFHAWMRDPRFSAYLRKRAETMFKHADAAMYRSLITAVENGDMKATQLMLEMKQVYTPRLDVSVNLDMVVVRFIEIIQKHVKDPAIIAAIASDIEAIDGLGGAQRELPAPIEVSAVEAPTTGSFQL